MFIHDASVIPFPGQLKKKDHSLSDSNVYHTLPLRSPNLTDFARIVQLYCVYGIPDRVFSAEKPGKLVGIAL